MEWFGPSTTVEINDRVSELRVRVTRHRRAIDFALSAAVIAFAAFLFSRFRSWIAAIFLLATVVSIFADWMTGPEIDLLVGANGLEVTGRHWRDALLLSWPEISGFEYREADEGAEGGLYARMGGWNSTLLIPSLSKEEAEKIIGVINRRFPYVEMADDSGGWLPMGGKSGLTTLGLSEPKK